MTRLAKGKLYRLVPFDLINNVGWDEWTSFGYMMRTDLNAFTVESIDKATGIRKGTKIFRLSDVPWKKEKVLDVPFMYFGKEKLVSPLGKSSVCHKFFIASNFFYIPATRMFRELFDKYFHEY